MKGSAADIARLRHIAEAIQHIENFSSGKSKDDLYNDLMYRFSIERQLEIIGEAANNLSNELTERFTSTPWPKIISFRNFLAHEYFGIDLDLVWIILEQNIPVLKKDIENILLQISS
jgi:uncharacterized protein with HEPN domain